MSGSYYEAIDDYKKVIELNPKHIEAYIGMATVKYMNGEKEPACADLKKAIEIGSIKAEELSNIFCK